MSGADVRQQRDTRDGKSTEMNEHGDSANEDTENVEATTDGDPQTATGGLQQMAALEMTAKICESVLQSQMLLQQQITRIDSHHQQKSCKDDVCLGEMFTI